MWKNVTSYSQGTPERKPTAWSLPMPGGFRLVLVWNHRDYPKEWVCHFHPLFENAVLGVKVYDALGAVKEAALGRVIRQLEQTLVFAKEAASQSTTSGKSKR